MNSESGLIQVGIYEQLITELVAQRLDSDQYYVGQRNLAPEDAALWLSRFLTGVLRYVLNSIPVGDNRIEKQIDLSNRLIRWLKDEVSDPGFVTDNLLDCRGKLLTALYCLENSDHKDLNEYVQGIFPLTGLTQSELFSGSNSGLSLEAELKREILSADRIEWLVSFIKWAGIRIFQWELKEFTRTRPLRVITTSYMGATDFKAVDFLCSLPNTEVKLSYNQQQERLHAKSYL